MACAGWVVPGACGRTGSPAAGAASRDRADAYATPPVHRLFPVQEGESVCIR